MERVRAAGANPEFVKNMVTKVRTYISTTEDSGNPEKIAKFISKEFDVFDGDEEKHKVFQEKINSIVQRVISGEFDWKAYYDRNKGYMKHFPG